MAHASGSGNVWSGIDIKGNARVQLGNSYHYGSSQDEKILSAILESLRYPEIGQRGHEVPAAGAKTFEWLFDETGREPLSAHEYHSNGRDRHGTRLYQNKSSEAEKPERSACAERLRTWLEADENDKIFWITGKPGSGKSTFMKFLRDYDQTDALLQKWAGDDKLIVADHFFWLPGKPIQNSAEGLLRTLLHTVLAAIASVETVAQFAFKSSVCSKRRWIPQGSRRPWSLSELKQSLESVSTIPGLRIFLLIDGLDECCPQHSHDDFIEMLLSIMLLPNFKSCVSSRPWLEFAARLRCAPSLCLDRITHFDMLIVVTNRLMQAARDQTQYLDSPRHDIHKLADSVVHKAQGVFLWLELVTRALVIEIKKDRGVQRTSEIVTSLPSDLEEYSMELICQRIDRSSGNISDTASVLKLASMLHESDSASDEDINNRYTFIDFWLLSRGALTALVEFPQPDTSRLDTRKIRVMLQQARCFLEQTCKDLLIIAESLANKFYPGEYRSQLDHSVQYLHISAYDFLTNGPLKQSIEQGPPLYSREKGFLPRLKAIRSAYRLLEVGADCSLATTAFHDVLIHQTAFAPEERTQFLRACESFAITHVSASCGCLGEFHGKLPFIHPALSDGSTPYSYIRGVLDMWPHSTIKDDLMVFCAVDPARKREGTQSRGLNLESLECRHLCKACIAIVHDCLYRGLSPRRWQSKPTHDDNRETLKWAQKLHVSRKLQTSRSRRSLDCIDTHRAQSLLRDPKCLCELCKVSLSSEDDCGLRTAFNICECAAYSAWAPGQIEHHEIIESHVIDKRTLFNKAIATLPFDIPLSSYGNMLQLESVQGTPDFLRFVWRRQKIRAVHSLITSIRKQVSHISFRQQQVTKFNVEDHLEIMFHEWLSFLQGFAPGLAPSYPGKPCSGGCGKCFQYPSTTTVCLTCDGLPLICEKCCNNPGSPHGRASRHFFFKVGYLIDPKPRRGGRYCGILGAVKELIKWYLSSAGLYGLEFTIPKDMAAIQEALETIPDIRIYHRGRASHNVLNRWNLEC